MKHSRRKSCCKPGLLHRDTNKESGTTRDETGEIQGLEIPKNCPKIMYNIVC